MKLYSATVDVPSASAGIAVVKTFLFSTEHDRQTFIDWAADHGMYSYLVVDKAGPFTAEAAIEKCKEELHDFAKA